jgi:hypothetical protein
LTQPFTLEDFYPDPYNLQRELSGNSELVADGGEVRGKEYEQFKREIMRCLDACAGYRTVEATGDPAPEEARTEQAQP